MVEQILELLQRTLNGFLESKGLGPEPVVITNIRDHDGPVVLAKEKIALVVINLVHEQVTAAPANRGIGRLRLTRISLSISTCSSCSSPTFKAINTHMD